MILAVDVQYHDSLGFVAGLAFEQWDAAAPSGRHVCLQAGIEEYVPGEFYKRELPCILNLLKQLAHLPECIVIDGFVYLDGHQQAGLGKHLHDALQGKASIIGVAKTSYAGIGDEYKVFRAASTKPLYVTCVGMPLSAAKANIAMMHGPHRMPTILKRVDQIAREQAAEYIQGLAAENNPG